MTLQMRDHGVIGPRLRFAQIDRQNLLQQLGCQIVLLRIDQLVNLQQQ